MLLSKVIGRFTMRSAKEINLLQGTSGQPFWQSRGYDHIVRSERALTRIREYIRYNPLKWMADKYNPDNVMKRKDG
jgi:hypothetical protein